MQAQDAMRQWHNLGDYQIAYRQWGREGAPLLLLHGLPTNSILWERTAGSLSARGYRVYAPEMLGLGFSEGPAQADHSLAGQAQLMSRFARQVIGADCLLVGHDLGGALAQMLMAGQETWIRKCVLTDCPSGDSWPVEAVKPLIGAAQHDGYARIFTPEFIQGFLRKGLMAGLNDPHCLTDRILDDLCQGLTGTTGRVEHFVRFLRAMDNCHTQEALPRLGRFEGPVLLVWARQDRFQPVAVGERLRGALPQADWQLIDGGHFHPLESTALADAIFAWDQAHR